MEKVWAVPRPGGMLVGAGIEKAMNQFNGVVDSAKQREKALNRAPMLEFKLWLVPAKAS